MSPLFFLCQPAWCDAFSAEGLERCDRRKGLFFLLQFLLSVGSMQQAWLFQCAAPAMRATYPVPGSCHPGSTQGATLPLALSLDCWPHILQSGQDLSLEREGSNSVGRVVAPPKLYLHFSSFWIFSVAQMVKNLPAMKETRVQSLGQKDPLEKGMAIHSSVLAWRIPWTEDPGRPQSMGSQRVRHDWATNITTTTIF